MPRALRIEMSSLLCHLSLRINAIHSAKASIKRPGTCSSFHGTTLTLPFSIACIYYLSTYLSSYLCSTLSLSISLSIYLSTSVSVSLYLIVNINKYLHIYIYIFCFFFVFIFLLLLLLPPSIFLCFSLPLLSQSCLSSLV